jgi:hypothetical protein
VVKLRLALKVQAMDDKRDKASDDEAEVEREIRERRKFTPGEALARMAGPGAMKGASPVSRVQQAETEIGTWLRSHLSDPAGALALLLHRNLKGSEQLLDKLDDPLGALAGHCRDLLASDYLLEDLVRQADVEWGRAMDERPHFEREGFPQDPDDPYTAESVRSVLVGILRELDGRGDLKS